MGEEGITLVDTKLPGWGQALMDRIRTVSDKPVTTIINTHTHGDHVGSNAFFPESVQIVVHENTEANMGRLGMFEGATAHGMPDTTYTDNLTLGSGADRIEL
ncbi:MAG: MBL fold metallo-hydrolase, partial [Acidobacteria bacterium]|nr:MBL fold metallo-hydrolase [Acidobacteriota bacterium]